LRDSAGSGLEWVLSPLPSVATGLPSDRMESILEVPDRCPSASRSDTWVTTRDLRGEERTMTEPSTSHTLDEVPEADFAEQSVPAYPDADADTDDTQLTATVDRDTWSADPADVVEQSIPVPLDDEERAAD
jgi:hypothetical protein